MNVPRNWLTACPYGLGRPALSPCRLLTSLQSGGCSRLSEVYGVPFSENRGKSILTSLAGAMSAATAATTMTSLMKGVPIIGTAIGALTMPAVAACATWVIGKVFMKHFASGGTLLDFNPPDYREFIKVQKTKFAARREDRILPAPSATAPAASDTAAESKTTTDA